MATLPKLARHDWVEAQLATKLDAPTGTATPGRILAAKEGGGTEWVVPSSTAIEHTDYAALITD